VQRLVELRANARRIYANRALKAMRTQRCGGALCKCAQVLIRRDVKSPSLALIDARGVAL